jgi:DNA-binding GntR family transcriptional regulator
VFLSTDPDREWLPLPDQGRAVSYRLLAIVIHIPSCYASLMKIEYNLRSATNSAAGQALAGATLPEVIYQRIRADILNGILKPGETLRQEVWAQQFGASRVPLREALSRLEAEGLIVLRPRRGYAVTSLDRAEILEIFELRMVIEEHAGYIAGRARTGDDIRRLAYILQQFEALERDGPDYSNEWAKLNLEFHESLIASGRRKHLSRVARQLHYATEPYIRVEARMTGDMKVAEQQHREIFAAFEIGDASTLAELCCKHVESTAKRLLTGIAREARPLDRAMQPTE